MPTNANKKLYNAGSEWQDDIDGLADYYSTFFREYDPVIGRFNGVDPMSASFESWTTYHYSYDNPVNFNDPMGDYAAGKPLPDFAQQMRDEYNAWHDSRYGNNLPDRGWDFGSGGGFGDDGGGGGGITDFDFWSTYGGMKIRQRNDPNAQYETNEWGEFGYWLRDRSYSENNGSKTYVGGHLTNQTYGEVVMIADKWVSISNAGWNRSEFAEFAANSFFKVMEKNFRPTGDKWLGKNGKYYNSSWGGNKHSGGRSVAYRTANTYKGAGRGTVAVSLITGGIDIYKGYQQDGGQFGYNSQRAAASTSGAIMGGWAGAEGGAVLGAAIGVWFGGVGAVPGAIIGGLIGSFLGSWGGSELGDTAVDYYYK